MKVAKSILGLALASITLLQEATGATYCNVDCPKPSFFNGHHECRCVRGLACLKWVGEGRKSAEIQASLVAERDLDSKACSDLIVQLPLLLAGESETFRTNVLNKMNELELENIRGFDWSTLDSPGDSGECGLDCSKMPRDGLTCDCLTTIACLKKAGTTGSTPFTISDNRHCSPNIHKYIHTILASEKPEFIMKVKNALRGKLPTGWSFVDYQVEDILADSLSIPSRSLITRDAEGAVQA